MASGCIAVSLEFPFPVLFELMEPYTLQLGSIEYLTVTRLFVYVYLLYCRKNPVNIKIYLLNIFLYVNKLQCIIFITYLYTIHTLYKKCPLLRFST